MDTPNIVGIDALLRRRGRENGSQIAVFDDDGALTYAELDSSSSRVAGWVRDRNLIDKPVVLNIERSKECVVALLGLLRGGAICVPVDTEDPPARRAAILSILKTAVVIGNGSGQPAAGSSSEIGFSPDYESADIHSILCADAVSHVDGSVPSRNAAFIFFTSGSSGKPKGVVLSHAAVMAGQQWLFATFGGKAGECFLFRCPIGITNVVRETIWPILAGASSYLLAPGLHRDPEAHIHAVIRHNIVNLVATPALLERAMDHSEFRAMKSLRQVIVTSDTCHATLVRVFQRQGLSARLFNLYGLTEALYGAYHDLTEASLQEDDPVPIGRPAELNLEILNEDMLPVPEGEVGELFLSGTGIADCYYDDPELTRSRFILTDDGKRLFKTGDLAKTDQSRMTYILGRKDLQLKVRGYRIETEEIEAALLLEPDIQRAGVVQRDVGGMQRLVAFYSGANLIAPNVLRQRLAERLPSYGIPALLIPRPDLPLTTSGKVDRQALKQEPIPSDWRINQEITSPETQDQHRLLGLWKEYLRTDQLGIDTDFFEAGGDSILSMLIAAKAKERGVFLSVADFFSARTVRALCRSAADRASASLSVQDNSSPSEKADIRLTRFLANRQYPETIERTFVASPMETGMLFHSVLEPHSGVYYEQLTHRLLGNLDIPVFQEAWHIVSAASSSLRSCFVWEHGGQPHHVVVKQAEPQWDIRDFSNLSTEQVQNRLGAILSDYRAEGFNLRKAPLIRFLLLKTGADEHLFTVNYHHILLDAWSFYLVIKSVLFVYQSLLGSHAPPTIGFVDTFDKYVAALTRMDMAAARGFWKGFLADYRDPFHICGQLSGLSGHGDQTITIEGNLVGSLRSLARRLGVTINTAFMAAWLTMLWALSDRKTVTAGMIITLRPPVIDSIEKVVGVCVNTIPAKTAMRPAEGRDEFILRLFREQEELRRYEYLPISEIQALAPLDPGMPLFDSLLIFENFQVDSQLAIAAGGIKLECLRYDGCTNYPLSLTINNINDMSGLIDPSLAGDETARDSITIRFKNDRRYFSDADARKISACFRNSLLLVAGVERTVADLGQEIRAAADYAVPKREEELPCEPQLVSRSAAANRQLIQTIADHFGSLLGGPIGVMDNFFEKGGTSFKALQLVGHLCETFKADIPLEFFFKNPTADAISRLLEEIGAEGAMATLAEN
jgi:amino acid adenylation domain-containing protein